jgi:hypothetical protein
MGWDDDILKNGSHDRSGGRENVPFLLRYRYVVCKGRCSGRTFVPMEQFEV